MSGHRIKELRLSKGYTLERLSDLSGVDVGTISALEVRNSSRSKFFPALAGALGISLDVLMSDSAPASLASTPVPTSEKDQTHSALKKKLKDWRMHASPRSIQVIDQLTMLAERDALREDDWTLIETMARRLKATT